MRGILIVLGLMIVSPAFAQVRPSFDCRKASTMDEAAICSDPRLAELDRLNNAAFLVQKVKDPKGAVEKARSDVAARGLCGPDKVCILDYLRFSSFISDDPSWASAYEEELILDRVNRDMRPRTENKIGLPQTFLVSYKAPQLTILTADGLDTPRAHATGSFTRADAEAICSGASRGRAFVPQCVRAQMEQSANGDIVSISANCPAHTVTEPESGDMWKVISYDGSNYDWNGPNGEVGDSGTGPMEAAFDLLCPNTNAKIQAAGILRKQMGTHTP